MKNQDLKQKYDTVFKNGSDTFFTCNIFHEAHTIVGAEDWSSKRVMDVGCGEGILPTMIAHAGAEYVVGVDYSSEAIANANNKFDIPKALDIIASFVKPKILTIKTQIDTIRIFL